MKKETESKTLNDTAKELEIANLHAALADERLKNEVLSRRCIQLGVDLEEDSRIEKEMIDVVNRNSAKRQADAAAQNRRLKRIALDAYANACTRNAIFLGLSILIGAGAAALGFFNIINPAIGFLVTGICTVAFGWLLNDCMFLLRCWK